MDGDEDAKSNKRYATRQELNGATDDAKKKNGEVEEEEKVSLFKNMSSKEAADLTSEKVMAQPLAFCERQTCTGG